MQKMTINIPKKFRKQEKNYASMKTIFEEKKLFVGMMWLMIHDYKNKLKNFYDIFY